MLSLSTSCFPLSARWIVVPLMMVVFFACDTTKGRTADAPETPKVLDAEDAATGWWEGHENRCALAEARTPFEKFQAPNLPPDIGAVPSVLWEGNDFCPEFGPVAQTGQASTLRIASMDFGGSKKLAIVLPVIGPPKNTFGNVFRGVAFVDLETGISLGCFELSEEAADFNALFVVSEWNRAFVAYVTEGGESAEVFGRRAKSVIEAFDPNIGRVFQFAVEVESFEAPRPEFALGDHDQVLAGLGHRLISLDGLSGELLWTVAVENPGPFSLRSGAFVSGRNRYYDSGPFRSMQIHSVDRCGATELVLPEAPYFPLLTEDDELVFGEALEDGNVNTISFDVGGELTHREVACTSAVLTEAGLVSCVSYSGANARIVFFEADGSSTQSVELPLASGRHISQLAIGGNRVLVFQISDIASSPLVVSPSGEVEELMYSTDYIVKAISNTGVLVFQDRRNSHGLRAVQTNLPGPARSPHPYPYPRASGNEGHGFVEL